MGALTFSIDVALVEYLQDALPLEVFVETGTFEGEAVERVLGAFSEIHTIELVEECYERARERFRDEATVTVHHGDSRRVLGSLQKQLRTKAVLYWLDAHWCGTDEATDMRAQCPLLGELEAIGRINSETVILIDDARLFLATPPRPHDVTEWPRFQEVFHALAASSSQHELTVLNDVIVWSPSAIAETVSRYARSRGFDLLAAVHKLAQLEEERDVLREAAAERLRAIEEKEREIVALAETARERLETIERLAAELKERSPPDAAP